MARRKDCDVDATRVAVLDSAEKCFRLLGSSRASMEEIATQAGWSRGAANYHFRGKAELLRAVVARGRLPLAQDLERIALTRGPVVPALMECTHRWIHALQCDQHARNALGILAWAYDYADDCAGIRAEAQALAVREFRLLRGLMQRAEAAGELRMGLGSSECTRVLAAWWLGAAAACVATPYRSGAVAKPYHSRSARAMFALISRGARRKPARRPFFSGIWKMPAR